MSEPYERARGGRLTFKGGELAARKSIDKKKKQKKKKEKNLVQEPDILSEYLAAGGIPAETDAPEAENIYTIDAAKRMKYDELFPVEAKKFAYEPKSKSRSVEEALDDRVKKKADRYCK